MSDSERKVFLGPWVGFKVLEYKGNHGPSIVSPYRESYQWWPYRTSEKADCRMSDSPPIIHHDAPKWGCNCGYYAYLNFKDAKRCQKLFRSAVDSDFEFIVLVVGWGKVITHETGFRSSHMEVMAVHNADDQRARVRRRAHMIEKFAREYGIPYMSQNDMEDYAHEIGVVNTEETLP